MSRPLRSPARTSIVVGAIAIRRRTRPATNSSANGVEHEHGAEAERAEQAADDRAQRQADERGGRQQAEARAARLGRDHRRRRRCRRRSSRRRSPRPKMASPATARPSRRRRRRVSVPTAATAAEPAITVLARRARDSSPRARVMADRPGAGRDREQHARHDRDPVDRRAELGDIERQHRAEAAVDELQAEDDRHQQHEVLEREHVAERDALLGRRVARRRGRAARDTS